MARVTDAILRRITRLEAAIMPSTAYVELKPGEAIPSDDAGVIACPNYRSNGIVTDEAAFHGFVL
jgi:hypothetical protein